ncbi:MAG: ABZJ_00895 family protein [Pseudomonadota bacterium]
MTVLPSIILFNALFFGITFIIGIINALQLVKLPSGMSQVALIAASFFVAQLFVKKHQRAPNRGETWSFALGALASSSLLSILIFVGLMVYSPELWSDMQLLVARFGPFWLTVLALVVSLVYLALLYFVFGPCARWMHASTQTRVR